MKTKVSRLLILFLVFTTVGFSQTQSGTFALSGKTDLNFLSSKTSVGTDSIETGSIKNEQFGVTIGVGYFVANNLMVGVSGKYSHAYTKVSIASNNPPATETITSTLALVPHLTYYFPLEGKLRPSISAGAGYMWQRERDSRSSGNDQLVYSFSGPSFNAAAGLSYFVTKSISFDVGLQYSYNKMKDKQKAYQNETQNAVAAMFGISVFL